MGIKWWSIQKCKELIIIYLIFQRLMAIFVCSWINIQITHREISSTQQDWWSSKHRPLWGMRQFHVVQFIIKLLHVVFFSNNVGDFWFPLASCEFSCVMPAWNWLDNGRQTLQVFSNTVDVLFSFILSRNLPFHFQLTSINTIVIIREGDYPKYDIMALGRGGLDSGYSLKMMMSFMNSP